MKENVLISETVEKEARRALSDAVEKTIRENASFDLMKEYGLMVLQHLVLNDAYDKIDYYVEECSVNPKVSGDKLELMKRNEVEPFLTEIVKLTNRYLRPPVIPRFVKGSARYELTRTMMQSLPSSGIIYKGMPGEKDLIIMSEAALIYRRFRGKMDVYIASVDYHFIPNPVRIAFSRKKMYYTGKYDSGVRDKLTEKFGFKSDDPKQVLYRVTQEIQKRS